MRTPSFELAKDIQLPANAVTEKLVFIGRTGSGKTYAAQKLAEEFLGAGAQTVILDPVGNWWGLRLAAGGQGPGLNILVFGGLHGDVPLEPTSGKLVADLITQRGVSVILDVSMMRKGQRKEFATELASNCQLTKSGTFNTYLSKLRTNGLIFEGQRGYVRAADVLFLTPGNKNHD